MTRLPPIMPGCLITLEEALASLDEQRFGTVAQYAVGENDGTGSANPKGRRLCDVEVPYHLAQVWTVTMGQPSRGRTSIPVGAINLDSSTDIRRGFAIVEWGVGGFSSQVFVDWRQGQTVRVFGNYVKVSSFLPEGSDANAGGPVVLGASISPGACDAPRPTRTLEVSTPAQPGGSVLAGTTSSPIAVPRFAYEAMPILTKPQANDTWDLVWTRVANTIEVGRWQAGPGSTASTARASAWAPVPPNATTAAFENTDINDFTNCAVQFRLAL